MIKSSHAEKRQLISRKWPTSWRVVISILLILAAIGLLPLLAPQDPYRIQMGNRLQPSSAAYWLGTNHLGRDVLSRVMTGFRTTLGTSLVILAVSLVVGVPLGLLSGFVGGWTDRVFKRVIDAFMTLPDYIFAIVLSGLLGPGLLNLIFVVTAAKWVSYARLVRSTSWLKSKRTTLRCLYWQVHPHCKLSCGIFCPMPSEMSSYWLRLILEKSS